MDIKGEEILYVTFNQDQECFVCGTNYGFKIFKTNPFKQVLVRDLEGGIGIVEMLYKSNLMALVGGGANPKYPRNKVVIWDDYQGKGVGEITFNPEVKVKGIKLRPKKIAILTDRKIYIHNLTDLTLVKSVETGNDPKGEGLFCFSLNEVILCCPTKGSQGSMDIINLEQNNKLVIRAHETMIWRMEINATGDKIATASEKGTLIRLFNSKDGSVIQELRRGTEQHEILSIQFSIDSQWLSCSSNSGTTHIFSIGRQDQGEQGQEGVKKKDKDKEKDKDTQKNHKSKLSFLKIVHPYFNSEWSYCQLKLSDAKAKICFIQGQGGSEKKIVALSRDGKYAMISYDKEKAGQIIVEHMFSHSQMQSIQEIAN